MRSHFAFLLLMTLISFLSLDLRPAWAQKEQPLSATAQLTPYQLEPEQIAVLEIQIELPEGYKAYEDQFKISIESPEGFKVSQFQITPLKEIFDKFSKKKRNVVIRKAQIRAPIEVASTLDPGNQILTVKLTYQACTSSYCLFPQNKELHVPFVAIAEHKATNEKSFWKLSFSEVYKHGLIWAFLFVFVFGLLTSFTPCIYPMIPITLAILGREAHVRNRWQSLLVSFVYVSGIGITFSALGVFAASTGILFGSFMSSPWVLGFVCLIFFMMSLSMFGLFELQAPQWIRDHVFARLQLHGYIGAFVSGMLAGVVASPCVGPVLVGILTFVAQTKNLWLGFWLLFVYALGMGMLFLALGFSTTMTKHLPKNGAWMTRIKIFFGLLMLGASLYYLDVLLVSSKVISQSVLTTVAESLKSSTRTSGDHFKLSTIVWKDYSDDVLAEAKSKGKPVLIDFRADWCAACLEMEEKTFTDQGLQLLSTQFTMVKFDATQESDALAKLKEKYQIVGLPTLVFISRSGEWIQPLTLTEFELPGPFQERMKKALAAP
ncbi:MAG: thiol:disulfide interchange protein [Bdellovibrio sp. CG10_big_fil_rev_8_21_14_0_10_47_8]|nr:MAG: thiol:disulfide interchange protein [Bdellovibrio sp. CG10_big_fil_rev_8_21_14_0_10_47_8]